MIDLNFVIACLWGMYYVILGTIVTCVLIAIGLSIFGWARDKWETRRYAGRFGRSGR